MDYLDNDIKINISNIESKEVLNIFFPKQDNVSCYRYEVYGNRRFYCSGSVDINSGNFSNISLEMPEDSLYFIKIIAVNSINKKCSIYFKFYEHQLRNKLSRNMTMKIMKKEQVNMKKNEPKLLEDGVRNDTLNLYHMAEAVSSIQGGESICYQNADDVSSIDSDDDDDVNENIHEIDFTRQHKDSFNQNEEDSLPIRLFNENSLNDSKDE